MEKQIRLQRAFLHWMGLPAHSPLSGKQLIEHLGIVLVQPVEIPEIPAELLHEVLNGSSEHWSDITFCDRSTRPVIIHNPKHAPSRQESDLMHETAHILCRHLPAKIVSVGDFALRTYDANHEKEAEWLGACLQITREGLLWAVRRRMTNQQIADLFGASEALIRFRRSTTAVDVQMTRRYSGWSTR